MSDEFYQFTIENYEAILLTDLFLRQQNMIFP
jgi:hypothetical protein